ncbi:MULTISPECIES: flagellar biosynthetic protein FliO [Alphaproteobacteria]|uniref:Flagellar biosynthesis protein FliO n=2 Tax=Alphaproteobacteria TaxID=28211 RepID=A0A512HCR3_9HYPH|nr:MULTISPECIES: flagellar biosynthetic protein FliO [Alphaproteobacteria]GEO83160.1 flagellar biosynthesis protein FliO [Ciceribacter naphthalenivorans]GLR20445.1 flagellar biosynthesis protein FliO [Ciceribacter naphthalenivorans]GLT03301.1 flagellar biosynthesis protein FliO [Sphingomonas psychrolutea]
MIDELAAAYGNRFLVAALGVSLALLCLFIVLWLLRNRAPSPFVRGGRNRQPRLQVLDAAAVDARRRLVLIRRDNVEHLVMIGGPTDIVIESGIGDERTYLSATSVGHEESPVPATSLPQPPLTASVVSPAAAIAVTAAANTPLATAAPIQPAAVAATTAPRHAPQSQPAASPEPRKTEAPKLEVAAPAAAGPAPVAPSEAARTESVMSETAKAEPRKGETVTVATPVSQPAYEAMLRPAAVRPVAEPARPSQPSVAVPLAAAPDMKLTQAPVVPPPAPTTPTQRQIEPSARVAASAAVTPPIPPSSTTNPGIDGPAKPAFEPDSLSGDAADILEAARQRVLPSTSQPAARIDDQPASPPSPLPAPPRELSAFERVLEEEMALHLAASDAEPKAPPQFQPILPETRATRPVVPPINAPARSDTARPSRASSEDPDLQDEIARIFGEMSAERN